MSPPPDVQIAAAALRATLADSSPRGSAVRAGVRTLARAAHRAGYPAAQLTPLLGQTLLPLLRTRHPGPVGDWLWERLVAWAREDYADVAADGVAAGAADTVGEPPAVALAGRAVAGVPDAPPVVYRLDGRDVVTRVNAAWRAFAAANGAPALAARVVGTSLWAHVEGDATRALYGRVHAAARRTGRPVTLPFRCDAPAERRWMVLTVRPLGGGHLQVVSALVRRAARPPVALLDAPLGAPPGPAGPRGAGALVMCSWCKRVRAAGDGPSPWVEVEDLPAGPPPAGAPQAGAPRIAHDACPDCAADVGAALASA